VRVRAGNKSWSIGLIAEDVAKVNPDLVVRDRNGEIYTVRYDAVNAMLFIRAVGNHCLQIFHFAMFFEELNHVAPCAVKRAGLRVERREYAVTGGNSVSTDKRTICKTQPMNKYILCLIGVIVAMAFIASSCQQQGTTTMTTAAAAKPAPTPSRKHHKKHHKKPATSPSPAESPAPTP
jgi:hypothetical protein